jgi:transposase
MKKQHRRVSAAQFVQAWQAGKSTAQVAERLGLCKHTVENRASRYRRRGVKLKPMKHPARLDVAGLNRLVDAADR